MCNFSALAIKELICVNLDNLRHLRAMIKRAEYIGDITLKKSIGMMSKDSINPTDSVGNEVSASFALGFTFLIAS